MRIFQSRNRVLLPLILVTGVVTANDFPTITRALYIQECMAREHSNSYETLYSCVCSIDKIAKNMSYDEFIKADSYMRMRNMRGERGGLFRGNPTARKIRKKFNEVKSKARTSCFSLQINAAQHSLQHKGS